MDQRDFREIVPLKSSREELHEQPENKNQPKKSCVASECVFPRWSKPESVRELMFVSKDILLIRVRKTLIFHNVKTQKEDILVVGANDTTPTSVERRIPLDSIGCVDCCNIDLLALAEQPPTAKVIVCRYPDLKVLATLTDSTCSTAYKSILFLRLEYLIGLRDYPSFDLVIWAWRIQEKLLVVNTGFVQPNQSLSLSVASGREVYLSQMEQDVRCRLQLWNVLISCKTVYAEKTRVELPDGMDPGSGCWTPSGWFVFCGPLANVYRTQPCIPEPELCVDNARNANCEGALIRPTRQGFVLYAADELMCFRDTKGVFTKIWTMVVNHTLQSMVATENDVYGWSNEGTLLEFAEKKERTLKVYGTNVKHFTFVKPTDETIATINGKNVLQVWDVSTGEFKGQRKLNAIATHLCSNPLYCYVAVSYENGKVELLSTETQANDNLELIANMVLCDDELSTVKFFPDGEGCVTAGYSSGRFYRVSISLGRTCSVMREYRSGLQIVDLEIFEHGKSTLIVVLHKNHKTVEIAANNIVIFDADFNVVFELNDSSFYYTLIVKWISLGNASESITVGVTVFLSRRVHLMTINMIQAKVMGLETVQLDHYVKSVKIFSVKNHCLTFGHDGTYSVYEFDGDGQWKKIVTVNCSQWQTGGLIAAQVDGRACNVLTLSYRGNFMCTSFNEICNHVRRPQQIDRPVMVGDAKTEGIGYEDALKTPNRIAWTMIKKQNTLDESKVKYNDQKNRIVQEFDEIKNELLILLEMNINGPDDTKINIEDFDLNVDYRIQFKEKCKKERREYESKIRGDINKFKMETESILKEHWESLIVKPKSIYSLKKLYKVDNYTIRKVDQEIVHKANRIINKRISFEDDANKASSKSNIEVFDEKTMVSEVDYQQSNDKLLLGSISHRFVDVIEQTNCQSDYFKLEMAEEEMVLLRFMAIKLKHTFNKSFDDLFIEKQNHLDELRAHNDRLRTIETEFRSACKIEPSEPPPTDYEWNQYEKTDRLICVEDDEVPVKPCRTPSSERTLSDTKSADDNQYDRQSSEADDFRRRALIEMMDGVLEKRWENELKKEVPRPRFMLEKNPEDFTEENLKATREYEKMVRARNDERKKYKTILEEEKMTIKSQIEETIDEFDSNVFKLFRLKLKYDSAIDQEYLKIIRLSKMLSDSAGRTLRIKSLCDTNAEIESTIAETTKKVSKTETTHGSLLNTIETLKHKNSVLNKRFKSEFPSKLIYEQALIAYNRRPKIQGNKNYSPLLGYQFVNTIMDPTDDKLDLLCPEFVKYLDTLRVYDDYKYVEDYKLNMDKEIWHKVCNFRRLKIESEFKISTYQKDATDKANLLDCLMRDKENKEATIEKCITSISKLESQNSHYEDDPTIQLVVKQGNTEIELTGHCYDFDNTTLIDKNVIEEVNAEIKETGKTKIDVLSNLLMFKRKCRLLKWEHVILKNHKLTLYKYRYDVITSMKVTENMLHYIKFRSKDVNIAKLAEQKLDKELSGIQITYTKEKNELMRRLDGLIDRIRDVKTENDKTDEKIEKMNSHLSELQSKIDHTLSNRLKLISDARMKNIMKRAQMITSIQELHKVIYVLQTELELLLLKTFPTLYTVPQTASIRK